MDGGLGFDPGPPFCVISRQAAAVPAQADIRRATGLIEKLIAT